jgi:hypothetical protein
MASIPEVPAPVGAPHGITLFDHAEIAAAITEGSTPMAQVIAARNLTEQQWNESTMHWMTRMGDDVRANAENARVAIVYSEAFGKAQDALKATVTMDVTAYAKLVTDIQLAGGPAAALAARGLSLADYLRLSRHFAHVMSADPSESKRFFEAFQASQPPGEAEEGQLVEDPL